MSDTPAIPTVVEARRPDGPVVQCVVTDRRQDDDGKWWYQLAPVPAPGEAPPAEPDRWPPPVEGWRRQLLYRGAPWYVIHRDGCWLPGAEEVTLAEAVAQAGGRMGRRARCATRRPGYGRQRGAPPRKAGRPHGPPGPSPEGSACASCRTPSVTAGRPAS